MLDGISNFERKRVKNLVNCSFPYSSALCKTRTLLGVPAQTVETAFANVVEDVSSTTFVTTIFVAQFKFLEKRTVKVGLSG
jgi:hypothetical protein